MTEVTDAEFLDQIEAGLKRDPCGFTVGQMGRLYELAGIETAYWRTKAPQHSFVLRSETQRQIARGLITVARTGLGLRVVGMSRVDEDVPG